MDVEKTGKTDRRGRKASFEVNRESEKDEEDFGEYFDGGEHDKKCLLASIEMAISLLNEPTFWPNFFELDSPRVVPEAPDSMSVEASKQKLS